MNHPWFVCIARPPSVTPEPELTRQPLVTALGSGPSRAPPEPESRASSAEHGACVAFGCQ